MNKGNKFIVFASVCACCCFSPVSASDILKTPVDNEQAIDQTATDKLSVERPSQEPPAAASEEPLPWQASIYGEDWQSEREKIAANLPEFAAGNGIPATDADKAQLAALPIETAQNVTRAIENYYMLLEKTSQGYAGRKFEITAARRIDGYILLWLNEPEIRDGGRSIIFSTAKNKIVSDFWDGGYRG